MIEWLKYGRVFLYEKQEIGEDYETNFMKIKWKKIRQMQYMNNDYGCRDFLEFVSPEFTKYIVEKPGGNGEMIIRSMG